jgi:phospholipase/carboxylesterase
MLHAIVRRPIIPSETIPILVLLHGLGADEHDLMGLASELDGRFLVVTLRAPLEYGPTGYAWFEITWEADGVHVVPEQVLASRDLLLETLKELPKALDLEGSPLYLGGFSQGAMMSLGSALAEPNLFSGVILMSGRWMPELLPAEPNEDLKNVPFLVQHGTVDQVLPVAGSRAIRDFLEGIGCDVNYAEYPMAHEINVKSLLNIRDWLVERLGGI